MKPEQKPDVSHYEIYRGKNGDHYIEVMKDSKKRYYITKNSPKDIPSVDNHTTSTAYTRDPWEQPSTSTRSPNNILHNNSLKIQSFR